MHALGLSKSSSHCRVQLIAPTHQVWERSSLWYRWLLFWLLPVASLSQDLSTIQFWPPLLLVRERIVPWSQSHSPFIFCLWLGFFLGYCPLLFHMDYCSLLDQHCGMHPCLLHGHLTLYWVFSSVALLYFYQSVIVSWFWSCKFQVKYCVRPDQFILREYGSYRKVLYRC